MVQCVAIESKLQALVSSKSCSEKWRADCSAGTDRDTGQLFVYPSQASSPSVMETGTTEGSSFRGVVGIVDTLWYALVDESRFGVVVVRDWGKSCPVCRQIRDRLGEPYPQAPSWQPRQQATGVSQIGENQHLRAPINISN